MVKSLIFKSTIAALIVLLSEFSLIQSILPPSLEVGDELYLRAAKSKPSLFIALLISINLSFKSFKFKASKEHPFKVYANDFDDNGTNDVVLSKFYKDDYVPMRGKECTRSFGLVVVFNHLYRGEFDIRLNAFGLYRSAVRCKVERCC